MKYNLKYTIFSSNNSQEEDIWNVGGPTIKPGKPNYGDAGVELNKEFTVVPSIFMNWFNSFTLVV